MQMLSADQSLRIQRSVPVRVTCLSGLLWVTQEGDCRDLFPAAGESIDLEPGGVILITALVPAVLSACETGTGLSVGRALARLVSRSWQRRSHACEVV